MPSVTPRPRPMPTPVIPTSGGTRPTSPVHSQPPSRRHGSPPYASRFTLHASQPSAACRLLVFDPRIEEGVQHVHDEVHRHETERAEEHDPLHDGIIAPADAVHRQ